MAPQELVNEFAPVTVDRKSVIAIKSDFHTEPSQRKACPAADPLAIDIPGVVEPVTTEIGAVPVTLVTVPPLPVAEMVIVFALLEMLTPLPAVRDLYSRPVWPLFTPRIWLEVPIEVCPVPPLVTGNVPVRFAALELI